MEKEVLVDYRQVDIHQKDQTILGNVNIQLKQGEFVYLIGKVGTGKTSLLKTMYAELDIAAGKATVLGNDMKNIRRKNVPALRRRLGIVFQDFQLLTDRSVKDNLSFVLHATGWRNKKEIKNRIEEVLRLVGMTDKKDKYPNELSGGEQQRIVIARAVLNSPQIILADEPTGNLDEETGRNIISLLYNLSKTGTLVIVTTHNMKLLQEFPGKVLCCNDQTIEWLAQDKECCDTCNAATAEEQETTAGHE